MSACGGINCEPRICTWKPSRLLVGKCDCVKSSKCVGNKIAAGEIIMKGDILKKNGSTREWSRWVFGTDAVSAIDGIAFGSVDMTAAVNEKCPPNLCVIYRDAKVDCAGMDWQGMTNAQADEVVERFDELRIAVLDNRG